MLQVESNVPVNNKVQFLLNNELHCVEDVEPTTTALNYLREDLGLCGTKEGCAEGDCGACTIIIADVNKQKLQFRSINACICLLPTLAGKAVFTVEGLTQSVQRQLHPIQQALVECHASQCGFCTAGFVMSLFALYKSQAKPDRQAINVALAGNLCRCTGYQPIIHAAKKMYEYADQLSDDELNPLTAPYSSKKIKQLVNVERKVVDILTSIKPRKCLQLAGINSHYLAPVTVAELAGLYKQYPDAVILAGGTDIGLWITKQFRKIARIIYIGHVDTLKSININKETMRFGATVALTEAFNILCTHYPQLNELALRFASPPIRNVGTLCGNIANGSPIGDSMPALIALGAKVVLRCGDKVRCLPLEKLYLGYQHKDMQVGEFVEAVQVPLPRDQYYVRAYKISKRFDQDISAVFAAFSLQLDNDNCVHSIRICYGGMAPIPKRASYCENFLMGKPWHEKTILDAILTLAKDYRPLTDMRASRHYRLTIAGNLLKRFYFEISADNLVTNVLTYKT